VGSICLSTSTRKINFKNQRKKRKRVRNDEVHFSNISYLCSFLFVREKNTTVVSLIYIITTVKHKCLKKINHRQKRKKEKILYYITYCNGNLQVPVATAADSDDGDNKLAPL